MPAFGESCRRRGHVFSSLDDPKATLQPPKPARNFHLLIPFQISPNTIQTPEMSAAGRVCIAIALLWAVATMPLGDRDLLQAPFRAGMRLDPRSIDGWIPDL